MIDNALKERVYAWNRDRGLTEYDPSLEIKMLTEELTEFWMAYDPAHIVQEYCDFLFVSYGTVFKIGCKKYCSMPMLCAWYKDSVRLIEFISDTIGDMEERVHGIIQDYMSNVSYVSYSKSEHIMNKAFGYVIEANEAKSAEKDSSGKVVKGDSYISPYSKIKETLDFYKENYASREA